jgi:hypothetical protein
MVVALFAATVNLNFAVLLLPVGIGLLRARRSSRTWAAFWIGIGYLGCVALAVMALVQPRNATAFIGSLRLTGAAAVPAILAVALILCALLSIVLLLLFSKPVNDFIARREMEGVEDALRQLELAPVAAGVGSAGDPIDDDTPWDQR